METPRESPDGISGSRSDPPQDEAAFRVYVVDWLEATIREFEMPTDLEVGSPGEAVMLAEARRIRASMYDAGLAGITWPREYGGAGLSATFQRIFDEEARRFDIVGGTVIFGNGLGMCGPTLLTYGTEEQKKRYVPSLLRGDEIWCQLFSEPAAGSDSAGVITRASRAEAGWGITGQKTWTSGAHVSRFGLATVRTNVDVPKHNGITVFVIDLEAPGVTVRPLRQATGEVHFNDVFFDDVARSDGDVVGDVDGGWKVATTLLTSERLSLGAGGGKRGRSSDEMFALARENGVIDDVRTRQVLADLYIGEQVVRLLGQRIGRGASIGRPGAVGSLAKLASNMLTKRTSRAAMSFVGSASVAWPADSVSGSVWGRRILTAESMSIAGGTDQIMRNIIGERGLELPKEPQVDRGVPFKEIAKG